MSKIPMIAVIDDDKIVRDAIHTLVLSLGYHASTFASASEFLQSKHVHDTSCLITDVRMPRLTGIELQERLIAQGCRIPIIFITGHPVDGARARAMKAGAVGFLSKPFNAEHLVACLDKALRAS